MSASTVPHKVIKLNPDEIPGGNLKNPEEIEKNSVTSLKRFLKCRGISIKTSDNKTKLIEKVKLCIQNNTEIDNRIYNGIWATAKEKENRKTDLNNSTIDNRLVFPIVGWSNFPTKNIPESFSYGSIYKYLIQTATLQDANGELIGYDTSKSLQKGREFFKSGHVTNLMDAETVDKHFCLKSDVHASMCNTTYKVLIMIHKDTGDVLDASCMCKASAMGRCNHVAGVLFAVEDYSISFGHAPISCTSKLCEWNQGRKEKKSTPVMKRQYNNKQDMDGIRTFQPIKTTMTPIETNNHLLTLCQVESTNNSMWKLLLQYIYEDYQLSEERLEVLKQNVHSLKTARLFGQTIPGEVPDTAGQTNSERWNVLRRILITASRCNMFLNIKDDNVYKKLQQMWFPECNTSSNRYCEYGKVNEPNARLQYIQETNFTIKETGLWVNPKYPGLGASPDGIVSDKN